MSEDRARCRTVSREMGITRDDLFRLLEIAIDHRRHVVQGNRIEVAEAGRRVTIRLSPQQERHLGALRLPFTRLEFEFSNYVMEDVSSFMARFDRTYQRGGG